MKVIAPFLLALQIVGISCARPPGPLHLALDATGATVTGLSSKELNDLRSANLSFDDWARLLVVSVSGSPVAIAGRYIVDAHVVHFTPSFPFDKRRTYLA